MCKSINVGIISVGKAVPERVLDNFELEKIVDTNNEWIVNMTGIKERRICDENTATSDLAIKAAKDALGKINFPPEDIDLIIVATISPDYKCPSVASIVQTGIGAKNAATFDLNAGCSAWVYSIATANSFIQSGMYENILVVGSDVLSNLTNWQDRGTCILFGDGAGAAIVSKVEHGYGFYDFDLGSDGNVGVLYVPGSGTRKLDEEPVPGSANKIVMCGQEVFKFAVKIQSETILKVLGKVGLTVDDVDFFVPHQANYRIIESSSKRLGIPIEKFMVNLDKYGNTSGASIPLALCEAIEENKIKKGDIVCVCGFGAGLTWASGVMKWAY